MNHSSSTVLMVQSGRDVFRVGRIAAGPAGTDQTCAAIQAVVKAARRSPVVRAVARALMLQGGAKPGQPKAEFWCAKIVYDLCRDALTYKADPRGVELVRTPETVLSMIRAGGRAYVDCDDATTLAAALVAACGFTPALIVVGALKAKGAPGPRRFQHILPGVVKPGWTGGTLRKDNIIPFDAQEGYAPGVWPPTHFVRAVVGTQEHAA